MSIFKNSKQNSKRAFSLGKPEAEAELQQTSASPSLKNIFIDEIGIIDAIAAGRFIITGRKGTGKSAIVGYIKLNSFPEEEYSYCAIIKPFINTIGALSSIKNGVDSSKIIYEWTIISKLIGMILETKQGLYTREIKALNKFYNKYFALFDIDSFLNDDVETNCTMSINLLLGVFSSSFTREIKRKETEGRPFYSFIDGLYDVICKVLGMQVFEDYEFSILFDDLDINFNLKDEKHRDCILSLIRIAKEINNKLELRNKVRVLLFLRDDVKRHLSGHACDCSKIFGSYEFPLNWFEGRNVLDDKLKLKSITNQRIRANFELRGLSYNMQDPWRSYVKEYSQPSSNSVFKALLDFTFYRPRDIVNLFLPLDLNANYELPLDFKDLKSLIKTFSERIYDEFNDEISIITTKEERDAIKVLIGRIVGETKDLSKGMSYSELIKIIEPPLDKNIIETLYEYDVIGIIDNIGDSHYHFRESFPSVPIEECRVCVPNIIRLYFDRSTAIHL